MEREKGEYLKDEINNLERNSKKRRLQLL